MNTHREDSHERTLTKERALTVPQGACVRARAREVSTLMTTRPNAESD